MEIRLKLLIVILLTGVTTMASADPGAVMRHHEKSDSSALARLDLSPEQTEKIRKLRIAFEESMAPLMIQEQQAKAELDILWLQMKPDVKKIKSAQKKIHDTKFQILEKRTDFQIALREILTEDQLSRFLAISGAGGNGPPEFDRRPPPPQMKRYSP